MKHHVSKVASTCFYQLRRLRQLRRLVGKEVTAQLVSALILSSFDYCNALLAGPPCSTIQHLQRVENAAARLVCDLRPHCNVWHPSAQRQCQDDNSIMNPITSIVEPGAEPQRSTWVNYRPGTDSNQQPVVYG